MTLEVKDPRAETGWAERGWSLLESDGRAEYKEEGNSRRKDPGWKTTNMRNKSSQSRLRHGRCQRAGKPPGQSRVNVFGFKEKGL